MKYHEFVDYTKLDPVKRLAKENFTQTIEKPGRLGARVVIETLGEPAVAIDFPDQDYLLAFNLEDLGTKNMIADVMAEDKRGKGYKYYEAIGRDNVAMSTNDLLSVGADPIVYADLLASGDSSWFDKEERTAALLKGFRDAAMEIGMAIPCGETPELRGIISEQTIYMAGASLGIVKPKDRLLLGSRIQEGDVIFGLDSNGVHANGISLIRATVEKLPDGYFTELPGGEIVGEELLKPTVLYTRPVIDVLENTELHYLSPITGHGWKKIMRAKNQWSYEIDSIPEKPEIFSFLQEKAGIDDKEAYYTWNMGVGCVVIAPKESEEQLRKSCEKHGLGVSVLGTVRKGEKRVALKPKAIVYSG